MEKNDVLKSPYVLPICARHILLAYTDLRLNLYKMWALYIYNNNNYHNNVSVAIANTRGIDSLYYWEGYVSSCTEFARGLTTSLSIHLFDWHLVPPTEHYGAAWKSPGHGLVLKSKTVKITKHIIRTTSHLRLHNIHVNRLQKPFTDQNTTAFHKIDSAWGYSEVCCKFPMTHRLFLHS